MKRHLFYLLTALSLTGCKDEVPMVSLGIDDVYYISRMQKLDLRPAFTGREYEWTVNGKPVCDEREYIFITADEGTYDVELKIIDPETPYEFSFQVIVLHEEIEYSPYIAKVYEYCPAPGQFVKEMPRYEEGDS